jgi:hypothetical protein
MAFLMERHGPGEESLSPDAAMLEGILSRAADLLGDLRPAVMARYYRDFPETRTLFEEQSAGHREKLEGEMVEQTLYCLMTWVERPAEVRIVLRSTVPHHEAALKVPEAPFRGFVDAVVEVLLGTVPLELHEEQAFLESLRNALHRETAEATRLFGQGPSAH